MLGLPHGKNLLVDSDPTWPGLFLEEKARLESALEGIALGIEHYGSTSVPGMPAKPILDLLVGVRTLEDWACCRAPLENLGYDYAENAGVPGHYIFGRGRDRSERTHLVHIVEFEGESWRSNLTFRDALRSDPDLRERYLAVKQNAVAAAPEGRSQYNTAKHGFIEAEKETLKNGSFPQAGYEIMDTSISATDRAALRESVFHAGEAGTRCLLDVPLVQRAAMTLKADLIASGRLTTKAEAIQTIAFDKTDGANWKVAWHQDLMFPFARPVRSPAYTLECVKEGVDYARPPRKVLEKLLAVRLHLDDCDETNGPLRVSPGSHLKGIIPAAEVASHVASQGEVTCLAREGQALLMRPLLLHASSKALAPKHRRVLHVVFHEGGEMEEEWHRRIE